MLKSCHRMASDKEKTFFFGKRFKSIAYYALYTAAVKNYGVLLEEIGVSFYIIDGSLRVESNDDDVAVRQQFICQRLLDSIFTTDSEISNPYTVWSVFWLMALARDPPMRPSPTIPISMWFLLSLSANKLSLKCMRQDSINCIHHICECGRCQ